LNTFKSRVRRTKIKILNPTHRRIVCIAAAFQKGLHNVLITNFKDRKDFLQEASEGL
jgi:hypothetical protein